MMDWSEFLTKIIHKRLAFTLIDIDRNTLDISAAYENEEIKVTHYDRINGDDIVEIAMDGITVRYHCVKDTQITENNPYWMFKKDVYVELGGNKIYVVRTSVDTGDLSDSEIEDRMVKSIMATC